MTNGGGWTVSIWTSCSSWGCKGSFKFECGLSGIVYEQLVPLDSVVAWKGAPVVPAAMPRRGAPLQKNDVGRPCRSQFALFCP